MILRILSEEGIELARIQTQPSASAPAEVARMLLSDRLYQVYLLANKVAEKDESDISESSSRQLTALKRMLANSVKNVLDDLNAAEDRAEYVMSEIAPHLLG